MRSIALGFWVRTGSRDETVEQAGISHFLEHLLFKGTDRFSSTEIDEIFDGMGAEINAGTGKETTSVYSRFLDQHLERAFDVMADMVLRPSYPDIDSERQVVIEEIAMYEDEPSDKVHDVLSRAVFGDHPLGRPVIGRAEVISSVPVPDIAALPRRTATARTTSCSPRRATSTTTASSSSRRRPQGELAGGEQRHASSPPPAPSRRGGCFHQQGRPSSTTCASARPGSSRDDERRFVLRVLDTILGGSTSSRLFQEIREKRGLAYAVYSYQSHYVDSGQTALYVGTRPENVGGGLRGHRPRARADPDRAGHATAELERAKENVKGRTVLVDGVDARAHEPARQLAPDGRPAADARRDAREDRRGHARRRVRRSPPSCSRPSGCRAAGVGGDEDVFRDAVGAVSPALAAA